MKRLALGLVLAALVGVAHSACPVNITCLAWTGDGHYTDGSVIPATRLVTYTVLNGPKGGPYSAISSYNGSPTQAFSNVQVPTPPTPKTCFVVTATADTPDDKGVLSKQTSSPSAEACDTYKAPPPPPTNGSIVAPTDGSIVPK